MGLIIYDSNILQCLILIVTKACCEGLEPFRTFEVKHIILSHLLQSPKVNTVLCLMIIISFRG